MILHPPQHPKRKAIKLIANNAVNDHQLIRYSRHILLPEIDIEGQEKLNRSHVLIVGMGGLGSPAAMYLAASGIGYLTLCDGDQVDLTNLQRQIIHHTESIGLAKVDSAKQVLTKINPGIDVTVIPQRIESVALRALLQNVDIVVDASDNFSTRHQINQACVKYKKLKQSVLPLFVSFRRKIRRYAMRSDGGIFALSWHHRLHTSCRNNKNPTQYRQ